MFSTRFLTFLLACTLLPAAGQAHAQYQYVNHTAIGAEDVDGAGATNFYAGYVGQFNSRMNFSGMSVMTWTEGRPGFTAPDMNQRDVEPETPGVQTLVTRAISNEPALVTLWAGPNDARQMSSPDEYPVRFTISSVPDLRLKSFRPR